MILERGPHYFNWGGEGGEEDVKPAETILACFDDRALERLVSPALQPPVKRIMDKECVATNVYLEREADNVRFARRLMNASIVEAAHQSGHRNLGHFYKRFQHRFDLTPSRYLNLMLEQRQESKGIK